MKTSVRPARPLHARHRQRGQAMIEYVLLLALIGTMTIAGAIRLQGALNTASTKAASDVQSTAPASGIAPSAGLKGSVSTFGPSGGIYLGDGSPLAGLGAVSPVPVGGVLAGKSITKVSVSDWDTCVIADAAAYCWGYNFKGELGDNSYNDAYVPVLVTQPGLMRGHTITDISVGEWVTCAVADGAAYCWGWNLYGQLGNGTQTDSPVPVRVTASGVLSGKTVTAISASVTGVDTCVVADGAPYCWGQFNQHGELGDGTNTGSLVPVAVVTAGALSGKRVTAITVGDVGACVIAAGAAYCWGINGNGQPGDSRTTAVINAPARVLGLDGKTVTAISSQLNATCAVASSQAYCWGLNEEGELGNGTLVNSDGAVAVTATAGLLLGKTVTAIAAGAPACAVADGLAYCWGNVGGLCLGDGTCTPSTVPVAVSTDQGVLLGKTVTAIASGPLHVAIIAQ